MTAPASAHADHRRRLTLIVEREYQPDPARCVAAIIKLLTYRPAASVSAPPDDRDSAGDCRPLGAGARPTMHEDRTCALQEAGAAFEEDSRRDRLTSTDKY